MASRVYKYTVMGLTFSAVKRQIFFFVYVSAPVRTDSAWVPSGAGAEVQPHDSCKSSRQKVGLVIIKSSALTCKVGHV